jgi:type 1 glutamine amidotransferase
MDFYKDTPQRKRAQAAPVFPTEKPLERWVRLIPEREGNALPIDDSDGGCDCDPPVSSHRAWTRQHPALEIHDEDAITDSAEAFYLMKQRGIRNVIVMGVHTNMCVLGRPFSIRQMVLQGQNVVLMRDMTDSMYNPPRSPHASHFGGTDLVVRHIEQFWCPTVLSTDITGKAPFRFAEDRRPHVVIVTSEPEYRTEVSLTSFERELWKDFRVSMVYGDSMDGSLLPGLDVLKTADLLLLSTRRRTLPPDQLEIVRDFIASGKPVVGIRTASHPFHLRNQNPPEGRVDWPEFDNDVNGGHYTNHHGAGPTTTLSVASDTASRHPILQDVDVNSLKGMGSLYQVSPLADSTVPLLIGQIPEKSPEPVAWLNRRSDGGLTFYTSLGHTGDFEQPAFRRMLLNACRFLTTVPAP